MGKRYPYRKRNRSQVLLFPPEWYTGNPDWPKTAKYPSPIGMYARPDVDTIKVYLSSLYGNIYTRKVGIYVLSRHPRGNHMLMGHLVGTGGYLSLDWIDLQKNTKWTETIQYSNDDNHWALVLELEPGEG